MVLNEEWEPQVRGFYSALRTLFIFQPVFDESLVAQLTQPVLIGLIRLAGADFLARHEGLSFLADIFRASLQYLDQVPTERRLDGYAGFPRFEAIHGTFEFGYGFTGRKPAEVAAFEAEPSSE